MSSPQIPRPLPDADSQAYWDGLRAGVLSVQRCRSCGHAQLYFRAMCRECWSRSLEVVSASGMGRLYSFTVVHQAANEALNAQTPFVLALVDLDEGPRVLTRIEAAADRVSIGMRLTASFHDIGGCTLLYFRPESA